MFLSHLFGGKEKGPAAHESAPAVEHLAPSAYFTAARMEDLRATFERLGIRVNSITHLDS